MRNYIQIADNLKRVLSRKEDFSDDLLAQTEYAIGQCKLGLKQLHELVSAVGFPDKKSEIFCFKVIKPRVYSQLLYFQAILEQESIRFSSNAFNYNLKLVVCQEKILLYFEEHRIDVGYFRYGCQHLDEKYFMRDEREIPSQLRNNLHLSDEQFYTWHDHTFSLFMVYDVLLEYIANEMLKGSSDL
jgi:hypothetical protein